MTDLSISFFILLFAFIILLVYLNKREQARTLGQMADSLEELYLLELKHGRTRVQKDLGNLDPLLWLASQAGTQLTLESCLDHSASPAWLNLKVKSGGRLVVSPLSSAALKRALPKPGSLGRLGKAFEPLLGHSPRNVQVSSRSLAEQEYFDLEAAEVGRQLGSAWGEVTRLWFYRIPRPRQA